MKNEILKLQTSLLFDNFKQPFFNVLVELEDHQQIQKTLNFEDYKDLIGISVREKKEAYLEIPNTPSCFYRGGITGEKDTYWVSFFVPKAVRQLVYSPTEEFFLLPYPNLFFLIEVKKGRATRKLCFSVKDDVPTDSSLLYLYPYGNVDNNGSICMGNCQTKLDDFKMSYNFVETFFLGRDAGHYYRPGVWAKPKVSLRELISLVNKKEEFPKEWLMPSKIGYSADGEQRTIGIVIKSLIYGATN